MSALKELGASKQDDRNALDVGRDALDVGNAILRDESAIEIGAADAEVGQIEFLTAPAW